MNPYTHLLRKVKSLLAAEAKCTPEERKANQWMLQVNVGGSWFIVGKGDVNTTFVNFNNKRKVMFPDDLILLLEKLAAEKYNAYRRGDAVFLTEKLAIKAAPTTGEKVYGITGVGEESVETLIYVARKGLTSMEWKAK